MWAPLQMVAVVLGLPRYTFMADADTRVFGLQTDVWAAPSKEVFLRYTLAGDSPPLTSLTICYRYRLRQYRDGVYFFSYATSNHMDNAVLLYQREGTMNMYYNDVEASVNMGLRVPDTLDTWHHHCHLIAFPEYRLYVDGSLAGSGVMVGNGAPLPLNGTIYIGQEQDALAGGLDAMQSTSAHIAQVNVWNTQLGEDVIAAMASCTADPHGNVFSTDVHNIEVVNASEEMRQLATLCRKEVEFVIVPEKWSLRRSLHFCRIANSEMFLPESDKLNEQLFNATRGFLDKCSGKSYRLLRLGATDGAADGDWRKFSNNAALKYTAWATGEPNDGYKSDCVVMRKSQSHWGDVDCKDEYCFPCLKDVDKFLQIRGLCFKKEHHTRFLLDGYVNGAPFFRGYYGHAVFLNESGEWVLRNVLGGTTLAAMVVRRTLTADYPLGRRKWQVLNPFCLNLAGDTVEMSLSSCATTDFMCADGSCVPRGVRCNLLEDCADGSDEERCDLLELSDGYHGHRPPPGITSQDPLLVAPKVSIVRFSQVDDLNLSFMMELEVVLAWTDRNLKFKNLKRNAENKLSAEETRRVWRPEMEFLNVNGGQQQELKQTVFVEQTGEAEPPLFNDVMMDTVFPAESGRLVQRTLYSASFSCNYRLFLYPFDTQKCSVFLRLSSATSSVVRFQNASVEYRGLHNLAKYTVGDLTVTVESRPAANDRLQATFELQRRYSLLVLTIFLPTFLILIIGYTTLFVRLQLLQVRAIMTLTTLLVLYTLFNQVSAELPDTAYIKMVDMWFFFCISVIFSIIVVHLLTECLPQDTQQPPKQHTSPPSAPPAKSLHHPHPHHLLTSEVTKVRPVGGLALGQVKEEEQSILARLAWWRGLTASALLQKFRTFVIPVVVLVFNTVFWLLLFT